MHRSVFIVVFLFCGRIEGFLDPEQEALKNSNAVQQRLDYVKRFCPIAEQYDSIVVECKWTWAL